MNDNLLDSRIGISLTELTGRAARVQNAIKREDWAAALLALKAIQGPITSLRADVRRKASGEGSVTPPSA